MVQVIVIGGSAGALDALTVILATLPPTLRVPIVLVLHILPDKPSYLVEVLGRHCALRVKEAEDKEPLSAGTLYVAPPNYHVLLEKNGCLALSVDEPLFFSRPSIDVLFDSTADAFGPEALGVLLTGASEDGARGLAHMRRAGGRTVVQSPESAAVRTMPDAALSLDEGHDVLTLPRIGALLAQA